MDVARLVGATMLVGAAASCRIYREAPSREDRTPSGAAAQAGSTAEEPAAAPDREVKPSAPAADALNLWVLNRPQGDLPISAEAAPVPAEPPAARGVSRAAIVVLGVGPGRECAARLAQRALDALSDQAPLDVLASALEAARRWRWPEGRGAWSAMLQGSAGEFGGVQSAPAMAFGAALLGLALESRAVLGGPRRRWSPAPSAPAELSVCQGLAGETLAGPIGVLLRSRRGNFVGGVVGIDSPADAGVVSIAAQYGVSLAVGAAGGVLMVGDCEPPPPERVAERVYASPNWVVATAEPQMPRGCQVGHALLTPERAWVASGSALAWAIEEAAAEPAPTQPPLPAPDGGLADPSVTP